MPYWIKDDSGISGPFSTKQLKGFLSDGWASENTLVSKHQDGPWQIVSKVKDRQGRGLIAVTDAKATIVSEPARKDEVKCPKCGSSSVEASLSGANLGMAALGTYSFGIVGGLAGASSGSKEVQNICKKCGATWSPRELYKRKEEARRKSEMKVWEAKQSRQAREREEEKAKRLEENAEERKKRNDPWPASVKWQYFTWIVDFFLFSLVITLPLWFFFGLSVAAWTQAGLTFLMAWGGSNPYQYNENHQEFGGRATFYVIAIPIVSIITLLYWAASFDAAR